MNSLRAKRVDFERFVKELIPDAPKGVSNPRRLNKRETLMGAYIEAPGQAEAGLGTGWAALNAVTYYADHMMGSEKKKGALAHSRLFGRGDAVKSEALDLLAGKLNKVEVQMVDGTYRWMSVLEAADHGVDDEQIGRALMPGLLED